MNKTKENPEKSYKELHRPASEFNSREEYLENELKIMKPRRWRLNLPFRDYRFEIEDLVPALSGTIGGTALYFGMIGGWTEGFGLSNEFLLMNIRFEWLLVSILFMIPISGFFNPRANTAGIHGPMIPLIPLVVIAGGHPLAMMIMIGVFGLILSVLKGGSKLVNMTSTGVTGGLIAYLGLIGAISQINGLRTWAVDLGLGFKYILIFMTVIVIYGLLAKFKKRWMAIPICSAAALLIALAFGAPLNFVTSPGLPPLNPLWWWGENTGWKLGFPNFSHFVAAFPFALLAVAMWPPDFLSHRIFQELNYPKGAEKTLMHVDDTLLNCSIRQVVTGLCGSGNITSSWGTLIIPAGIAKRPIPAATILMGIFGIIAVLSGYVLDVLSWPPVFRIALLVGVFFPLIEAGMTMIKETKHAQTASLCIFGSIVVNPVFGWSLTMLLDNTGLLGDSKRAKSLSLANRLIIPLVTFILSTIAMLLVGLIPGVPSIL